MRLGRGEDEGGGRKRPALLCGTFEALVGALFLDAGMDAVRDFIEPFLQVGVVEILAERRDRDPKSLLQEWVQSQGFGPPVYSTVASSGPEHNKTFEVEVYVSGKVYGNGRGHSKQAAAKAAARQALHSIGLD
jgi:ribonuclease-3